MSFSKKTWVDRVAESPLRRFLTIIRPDDGSGTFVADIERDEGTVTTEGDAFSAANMNDLETRIKNAFDDAGGGNFVGVRYHASLSTYPDYPCWEDMTAAERAKYDYSTGAIVTFIDDDMPDDIIGTTDISGIADGTLTGAVVDLDNRATTLDTKVDDKNFLKYYGYGSTSTSIADMYTATPSGQMRTFYVDNTDKISDFSPTTKTFYVFLTIKRYGSIASMILEGCDTNGTPLLYYGERINGSNNWKKVSLATI